MKIILIMNILLVEILESFLATAKKFIGDALQR